jgi:flagellar protein FliO/FliZ
MIFRTLAACQFILQSACAEAVADMARNVPQTLPVVNTTQWLAGLFGVLAIILVAAVLARRLGRMSGLGSQRLRIMAGISLGTREKAVLLQVGNKQILIGVAPGCVRTLCILEGEDMVAASNGEVGPETAFGDTLHELRRRKNS